MSIKVVKENLFYEVLYHTYEELTFHGIVKVTEIDGEFDPEVENDIIGDVEFAIDNSAGWGLENIFICSEDNVELLFKREITKEENPEYFL